MNGKKNAKHILQNTWIVAHLRNAKQREWKGYLYIHLAFGFMNNNYSFLFCLLYRRTAGLLSFSI
jgi:hypothetical protein